MSWNKKIHVESSLPPREGQYAMFIGRWQPLHDGHKALFQSVLDEGKNVLICIRNGEVNEKNPYTSLEVFSNISLELKEQIESGRIKVMVIPDICSVEFGRGVGYDIIEHIPPTEIAEISATKIREQLKSQGKL
jgi:phosphopantetheine adenylyltransferase